MGKYFQINVEITDFNRNQVHKIICCISSLYRESFQIVFSDTVIQPFVIFYNLDINDTDNRLTISSYHICSEIREILICLPTRISDIKPKNVNTIDSDNDMVIL